MIGQSSASSSKAVHWLMTSHLYAWGEQTRRDMRRDYFRKQLQAMRGQGGEIPCTPEGLGTAHSCTEASPRVRMWTQQPGKSEPLKPRDKQDPKAADG